MKRAQSHLLRLFVTGLLAALPLAATVAVLAWMVSLLFKWLGPDSAIGSVLVRLGLGVTGSEVVGYLIGIGLVLLAMLALGTLVETGLQRGVARVVDGLVRRIPVVRQIYDVAHKLVGLLGQRGDDGTRAMRPVWCHFGDGRDGAVVLGLQSSTDVVHVNGRPCLVVLVPTAPVPVGGGLLFVPAAWVEPADLSVEAVTSLYLSMGVTAGQHLPVLRDGQKGAASTPT